jgi:hypothetical protein
MQFLEHQSLPYDRITEQGGKIMIGDRVSAQLCRSMARGALLLAGFAASLVLPPGSGRAYTEIQQLNQQQATDANGIITVETAIIHVINCTDPGENQTQIYVYEYVNRVGFRAVLPPNWGTSLGGGDYVTLAQAAGAGCRA